MLAPALGLFFGHTILLCILFSCLFIYYCVVSQAAGALAHLARTPEGATAVAGSPQAVAHLSKLLLSAVAEVRLAGTMALSVLSSAGQWCDRD